MANLLFGTAGIPLTTPAPTTPDGIRHVRALGLDALEIEFVRQVYLNESSALEAKQAAREAGVSLSVHAPYYLNLNSEDPYKKIQSQKRIYQSALIGNIAGATGVVFHPGYYMKSTPEDAFASILSCSLEIEEQLAKTGGLIKLMPETTGKLSQFGNMGETLNLCTQLSHAVPCIDFAHLHAYRGQTNSYNEFASVLEQVGQALGPEALQRLHLHVSGIHYGHRGELKHLPLQESDFNYTELLQALIDYDAGGTIICESPNIEYDALVLKDGYLRLKAKPA